MFEAANIGSSSLQIDGCLHAASRVEIADLAGTS